MTKQEKQKRQEIRKFVYEYFESLERGTLREAHYPNGQLKARAH